MLHTKRTFDYEYPLENADVCIIGIPFNSTEIGQSVKHGPLFVREAIRNLIGYNPKSRQNIFEKYRFCDAGDIEVVPGSWSKTKDVIISTIRDIFSGNESIFPIFLGGEHLITLATATALKETEGERVTLIDFDAHKDLLPDWLGEKYSHITWAYHLMKTGNFDMIQIGCRAYDKTEEDNSRRFNISDEIKSIKGPVYLSIDLDVLDPSVAPEVGTQQAEGITFAELKKELMKLKGARIIGMDIVECASREVETKTAHIAAEIIRTVLEIRG
ncbi:MAG: arginase family protein [Candidatus Micrarchaeota archaeon]|nr:arginase family protein [Candidatus Micrarchaeota archaeon]